MVLDYYRILGLRHGATHEDVKRAYLQLAKTYHPDKNIGDSEAQQKFIEIQEAYNVLITQVESGNNDYAAASEGLRQEKRETLSELSKEGDAVSGMDQYNMYYSILQLKPGALANEIQSSYYKLMQNIRNNNGLDAKQRENQINQVEYAYRVLMGKDDEDAEEW